MNSLTLWTVGSFGSYPRSPLSFLHNSVSLGYFRIYLIYPAIGHIHLALSMSCLELGFTLLESFVPVCGIFRLSSFFHKCSSCRLLSAIMKIAKSQVTADKTSWSFLPADIRILILEALLQDGCSLARFAIVSLEWQMIIEPHNFARIKLTSSRLAEFGPMIYRNRALVQYIWLCLELQKYDCTECAPHSGWKSADTTNPDAVLVTKALQSVLSTLSTWEPNGELSLDISVHSPSDSEHWFKYLTFEPDLPSDQCGLSLYTENSTLAKFDDHQHGWLSGSQSSPPPESAFNKIFDDIIDIRGRLRWFWPQEVVGRLPLVPVVTGLLLRQQTRRRWWPNELRLILQCFPRLQDLYYEPWREWDDTTQKMMDRCKHCISISDHNHLPYIRLTLEYLITDR